MILLFLLISSAIYASTWQIQTVDSTNDVGAYTSIACDTSGHLHISYTDLTLGRLKLAFWTNPTWNVEVVGTEGACGYYSEIAISEKCHISHYQATKKELLYTMVEIDGTETISATEIVDTGGVGRFCDIVLDKEEIPHIAYYDEENSSLKYCFWTGEYWASTTVDCVGGKDVGRFCSLFLAEDSLPMISSYNATDGDLRFSWWNVTGWATSTVDTEGDVGRYSDITGTGGTLYIAYYDATNQDLKCAKNSDGTWTIETVDSGGDVGKYCSIALCGTTPYISYYDATNGNLNIAWQTGTETWGTETVDFAGDVGMYTSLAICNGVLHISYYDATCGDLRFATTGTDTLPNAPSDLSAEAVSTSTVELLWSDNSINELWFLVERGTDGVSFAQIGTTTFSTYTDTALSHNTTYYYRVCAYNAFGTSGYSNIASATTFDIPPQAPSTLTATATSASVIQLSWSDNSLNEIGFLLERGTDGVTFSYIGTTTYATYTDTGLCTKTTYYYRVAAYNDFGTSSFSNIASATTHNAIPDPPSTLTATALSTSTIELSWEDNSLNETGFVVERGTDGVSFSHIGTTTFATYTDTALSSATTYYYRVAAFNAVGTSSYSNIASATTLSVIPDTPTALSAYPLDTSTMNLSWRDNSYNEDGFLIERGTDGVSFAQIGTTTFATYTDTGLSSNTTYYYRVAAYNVFGTSGYSNIASATTRDLSPTDLLATATSAYTIDLSWSDNSYNELYFVIERGSTITALSNIGTTTASAYTDTALSLHTTYYYRVYAETSYGTTAYSNIASATTFDIPPDAPSDLIATALSNSDIKLSWSDNSHNEKGFVIERIDGTFTEIAKTSSNTTEYTDTGLLSNTVYYYRVAAYNDFGTSSYSAIASATTGYTLLYISPSYTLIGTQSTATITINIENVVNMTGVAVYLSFDPDIVSVSTITQGSFPSGGNLLCASFDNASGTLIYSVALLSGSATGSGVLGTITVEGVSSGTTLFSFETSTAIEKKTHMIDNNGDNIPFDHSDGTISCAIMGSVTGKVVSAVCDTQFLLFSGITVKIGEYATTTDGSSTFSFPAIPKGTYTLWADTAGAGSISETVYIAGGDQDLGTFCLLAADTDDSGQVNLMDFYTFRASYGSPTPNPEADFDHDSDCDLSDFYILRENFGKVKSFTYLLSQKPMLYIVASAKDGEVEAEVRIGGVSRLIGLSLSICWKEEAFEIDSWEKGEFVEDFSLLKERAEDGIFEYHLGLLSGAVTGSGTILKIRFARKEKVATNISFGKTELLNSDGEYIEFETEDAMIPGVSASIEISPERIDVFKDEPFTLTVTASLEFIGARLILDYPLFLELIGVEKGDVGETVFLYSTSTGKIEIVLAEPEGVLADGALFQLRFCGREEGAGSITFSLADFRDSENNKTPIRTRSAEVFVRKKLLGDFDRDSQIDFDDLMCIVSHWKESLPEYDIGPADGTPPDLIVAPDGIIDFEDLMVLCVMWRWQKGMQNAKCRMQNGCVWMEKENGEIVIKYRGLSGALGGRILISVDGDVEVSSEFSVFFYEQKDELLEILFAEIDGLSDSGIICRIRTESAELLDLDIRSADNEKIEVKRGSLIRELSLKDSVCYPNPSRVGWVKFKVPDGTSIKIYNIAGELLFFKENFYLNPVWNTERVASGIYIYILKDGRCTKIGKIGILR